MSKDAQEWEQVPVAPVSWLWVKRLGASRALLGLAEEALDECGLVVHMELPEAGDHILRGQPFMLVETMAREWELPAPLSGKIVLVNGIIERNAGLVHELPGDRGWLLEIEVVESP